MPRIRQQTLTRVEQLASIYGQIQQCRHDALGYARQAGDLLLQVPSEERASLAAQAGIEGRRSRFVYVKIAENWEAVQHAASIREALKIVGNARRPGREEPLPFEERCVIRQHDVTGRCVDDQER